MDDHGGPTGIGKGGDWGKRVRIAVIPRYRMPNTSFLMKLAEVP